MYLYCYSKIEMWVVKRHIEKKSGIEKINIYFLKTLSRNVHIWENIEKRKSYFLKSPLFTQCAQNGFWKFYVINTSDNLTFNLTYCNPHTISFQNMHVQFTTKKVLHWTVCSVGDKICFKYQVECMEKIWLWPLDSLTH